MKACYPKGCAWSYGFVSVQVWFQLSCALASFCLVFVNSRFKDAALFGPGWINSSLMPSILSVAGPSTGTEVRYFANSWEPFQGIPSGALLIPQPSQGHGCGVAPYLAGWVKSVFQLEVPREQKVKAEDGHDSHQPSRTWVFCYCFLQLGEWDSFLLEIIKCLDMCLLF